MHRRQFLAASGAAFASGAAAVLCRPGVARAADPRVLRFIPQSDLTVLDPVWTAAQVTRNHGFAVFDTLYGMDGTFVPTPQMVAGAVKDERGTEWRLGLRPGLMFHDGTPVLARDCVASIKRWGGRDGFGQALMAATNELSAPDDATILFRLKRPFPRLPEALGKSASNMCPIMPERLALTDPFTAVTEMVGSGPFRFKADERVAGHRVVYERFRRYVPRPSGTAGWTAGPKVANFDRVEWQVETDSAVAAAALEAGDVDWWEFPAFDFLPELRQKPAVMVTVQDPVGQIPIMRMNQLYPPFDDPAIRRAVLSAVSQSEFLMAIAGNASNLKHVPAGFFCPGTPMASDEGMAALTSPRDLPAAAKAIKDAGYQGVPVVVLAPTDQPALKALADSGADLLRRLDMSVDYQVMEWSSLLQRQESQAPPGQGGWNVFYTFSDGLDQLNPATNLMLRGNGRAGPPGWPTNPAMEALRDQWLAATEEAEQKKLAGEMQTLAFGSVPYIPLGQNFTATAYRGLSGVMNGFSIFWGVRRA